MTYTILLMLISLNLYADFSIDIRTCDNNGRSIVTLETIHKETFKDDDFWNEVEKTHNDYKLKGIDTYSAMSEEL